jgi:hypothetical protein
MTLSANETNAFWAVKQLFNLKEANLTSTTLKNKLLQEPTFPSLLSLSNVLTDFNVFNTPIVINTKQIAKIPLPAIAYLENGMGFVTISKVELENNKVEYCHDQLGTFKESITGFSQKWQGLVLIAKPNEGFEEENFEINLRLENTIKFRMPFIYTSLAFILGYFILDKIHFTPINQIGYSYGISFIKIVGLILSIILVRFSIYGEKSIVESTNGIERIKNNFITSLNLESRKIFGWLTWSDIGLIYFISGLSSLFLLDVNNALVFLKWLNFITIPYTIWAIYYQIAVIQKWCLICLGAMALLWIEFYFLINTPVFFKENNSFSISIILIVIILVIVNWVFIKKHLISSITNEDLYYSLQRIKFSSEYVRSIFNNNQSFTPLFEEMQTVLVGNPDAEHTLLAVLNPNSTISSIRFNELISLTTSNTKINCKIFLVPDSSNDLLGIKVIRNIFNLSEDQRLLALSNWFKQPNFKKYNFSNDLEESDESSIGLNANMNWAFLARIPLTKPTVFLNSNILPLIYTTKDIPILLRIINSKY